ncbi:MAG: trigger factor [Weeksellaceae bacterium]
MNITHKLNDDSTALLTVNIDHEDYKEKVENTLKDYRKKADIKGFRKGHAPMAFIKKQYEKAVIFDEVNQLLQTGINEYIRNEKFSLLGNPIPKEQEDFDWDLNPLNFEFELGLTPEFKVDLSKIEVDTYKIKVSDEEVQKYIDNFAKNYGSIKTIDKVEKGNVNLKVNIKELDESKNPVENGVNEDSYIFMDEVSNPEVFIGKKVGDTVLVKAKDINEDAHTLSHILNTTEENVKKIEGDLEVRIELIQKSEPSPVDQSLFDKVYGEGTVKNEKEFRAKVREEAEKMYTNHTENDMMDSVADELIDKTKFDLPNDFLRRWLHSTNEKINSIEEAGEILEKEERALRYQLIESKIAEEFQINVEMPDVEKVAMDAIKGQLLMYGHIDFPEEDLKKIVQSSLENEKEFEKYTNQVVAQKMKQVFKDHVKFNEKEVSFEEFREITEKKHEAHHHDHNHDHKH